MSLVLFGRFGIAAPKQHTIAFGKWTTIKWMVGEDEHTAIDLKIRPLLVDGQTKEFATGPPHDVTDRIFVVQRVFRLNDSLPQDTARWRWEHGGWLLVNRVSGKLRPVALPDFDPYSFHGRVVSRLCRILRRFPMTAKNCLPSSCNWAGASRC